MQSAKSILINTDFFAKNKTKRTPANEFQAYGYRLAHDLNDLEHLQIYMRLAKSTERSLMERAFSFVADSTTQEKGRLFLWKLKHLKKEMKFKINKQNFEYDFVFKVNKDFRNDMWQEIINKTSGGKFVRENLQKILDENIFNKTIRRKRKFLIYGYLQPEAVKLMINAKTDVSIYEYSKNLAGHLKNSLNKIKVNRRDFIAGKQKTGSFDVIVFSNMWQIIPKEYEEIFLEKLKRLIRKDGLIVFINKNFNDNAQSYKELVVNNLRNYYFQKSFTKENFKSAISTHEFNIKDEYRSDSISMVTLV